MWASCRWSSGERRTLIAGPGKELGVPALDEQRSREERAARNQALFRDVNEGVKELNEGFNFVTRKGSWICECANHTCADRLGLSTEEYEAVREGGSRFLVAPSDEHVSSDVERVVERHGGYWIVEMTGHAGELAEHSDPRSDRHILLRAYNGSLSVG
jgi:hypothetical protein